MKIERHSTTPGVNPYDEVEWERRDATITGADGTVFFEQKDVEFPTGWSQTATNIVAQKYFRGTLGTFDRERSVKQMISRVVDTITGWGVEDGYFPADLGGTFRNELKALLLHQRMAFNSPVWFNVGVEKKPQCSACFINSVEDSMESILSLAKTEGMLFKHGSGTGTNLSTLRSSKEKLDGGGTASGPVSFMRGFDAFAGAIKSGGKTRRAAKMVMLDIDHPDIVSFINCKADEEDKAWELIAAGYDPGFNVPGGAYDSVGYQNGNHSVRVSDFFMRAVQENRPWYTLAVTEEKLKADEYQAQDLFHKIAVAAHRCGDPGVQFDTTVNTWHTCKNAGRINASNPCSEYMFLDDTACNLASLNLLAFLDDDGTFNAEAFQHAIKITIIAMEIIVGNASYPTEKIKENSLNFRPLGLGYTNLGALLMRSGLPYDSQGGRELAAMITSLMTATAYHTSAKLAGVKGAFQGWEKNESPMANVLQEHNDAHGAMVEYQNKNVEYLNGVASDTWYLARTLGKEHGFRNSQVTVLAPTGTISFLMDCDTTGIEPELALVKYKQLVGGGSIRTVNQSIVPALKHLGYPPEACLEIRAYIHTNGTIEGAPHITDEHLPVFDCAFRSSEGTRSIHYMGHIRMMAAVQPFLSGAISKTVNLPEDSTVEDFEDMYMQAWKLGLKSVAGYRNGCKSTQPLSTTAPAPAPDTAEPTAPTAPDAETTDESRYKNCESVSFAWAKVDATAVRHKLPNERDAKTHRFEVGGHKGYLTVGMYENGRPGEIFIRMAKEGSSMAGMMDSFAVAVSLLLQVGVPISMLCDKYKGTRFEPCGFTGNPDIPMATSIMDYLFRWLEIKYVAADAPVPAAPVPAAPVPMASDVPLCHECGSLTVRVGTCHTCTNCGSTSGCS